MDKIRIGVMGCASIARRSVIPAVKLLADKFELVFVASRTKSKAVEFANEFSCEAIVGYDNLLLQDIDAVYIPLPTGLHEEWINKALLAGKHVYAEKSIANSYSSAKTMVENAKKNNLTLMEGYMFQYHPQHDIVKKLILNDEIGAIRCFRSSFGFPPLADENFRYNNEIGGGALFDAAGYTVKAAHFILGNDFNVVGASLFFSELHKTNLFGSAFLSDSKGVGAQIAFGFDNYYQCNYELWGSKGRIIVERAFTPSPDYNPTIILEKPDKKETIISSKFNHFVGSLSAFYDLITDSKSKEKEYSDILIQSKSLELIKDFAENKFSINI